MHRQTTSTITLLSCLFWLACGELCPSPRSPSQGAQPSPHPTEPHATSNVAEPDWVYIAGALFQMGSINGSDNTKPVHPVTISSFEISRSEVTIEQYARCVTAGNCTKPNDKNVSRYCNWGHADRRDHPVNCVDWHQANAYCQSLGGRLPSESEWEFAARSRGKRQKFPWGDEMVSCDHANRSAEGRDGCRRDRTWPVCSNVRGNTAQGLCDMAGNVREWVADSYFFNYIGAPSNGAVWVSDSNEYRVVRGGDWGDGDPESMSALSRNYSRSSSQNAYGGFRCVRPAQ